MKKLELDLIKAAWSLDHDDGEWMEAVHGATDALFSSWGASNGTLLWRYGFPDGGQVEFASMTHESPSVAATDLGVLKILAGNPEQEAMSRFYRSGPAFGTTDEQLRKEPPRAREHILKEASRFGYRDSFGYVAGDRSGGLAANSISPTVIDVEEVQRDVGLAMTSHMAAAHRLRIRLQSVAPCPDDADAVLSVDGDLVHQQGAGAETVRARLRAAAVEQVGAADGKPTEKPVHDAWRALVEGRWTLVDFHETRGRRLLLVYDNANEFANPRALTKSQLDVVALAARAHTNRQIATALGVEASTVASHLSLALQKLGLRRGELVRYLGWEFETAIDHGIVCDEVRAISRTKAPPRNGEKMDDLTPAEKEVAEMAARGMSNAEIAKQRATSSRTVANQLTSIFGKLGLESRNELSEYL